MNLDLLVQAVFVAILVATVVDFLRHRSRVRLDIVLIFSSLIIPVVLPQAAEQLGVSGDWIELVTILALLFQPPLLLRLVQHFKAVPRPVIWLARAGLLISVAVYLAGRERLNDFSLVILVVYFLAVEGYASWAFWQAARAVGGVVQRRLMFATAGSVFLAVTILLSGLLSRLPAVGSVVQDLSELTTLLSAVAYFIGFATPRPLRRAWQLQELYRFLRTPTGAAAAADPVRAVLDELCAAATRATGGLASAVWLWEPAQAHFSLRALTRPDQPPAPALPRLAANGPTGRAWHERLPVLAERPAHLSDAQAELAPLADALIAVPLISRDRAWGVLEVYLRRSSLFPDDDMALLALLAEQAAEALERDALYSVERTLLERLAQANGELQAEVAERRQAEEQIQQLNDSLSRRAALLEAANQELEAFSYSVSHDLRTPLRAIDGFSQALLEDYDEQLDETAQDYLQRIRRGAQRMALLIDDLLRLAWLSRATLTLETIDLSAMARAVLAELRAAEPGRTVESAVADGLTVYGDARLLRVALENLLGNAWKFTGQQPRARIEVSAGDIGGQPVYCVRDNGAGFDMRSADRLFGAFQRMHTLEEFPGTGIGLAIVQRIILRHAGRIWAESEPGQGAAFFFMLAPEGGV
jgi:signal transduction histidine kinase